MERCHRLLSGWLPPSQGLEGAFLPRDAEAAFPCILSKRNTANLVSRENSSLCLLDNRGRGIIYFVYKRKDRKDKKEKMKRWKRKDIKMEKKR